MWNEPTKEQLNRIPRLYETDGIDCADKIIHLHFLIGDSHWYIAEYDGNDLFFGYAVLNGDYEMSEWGYVSFNELKSIRIKPTVLSVVDDVELEHSAFFIEVDNDLNWIPKKFSEIRNMCYMN